MALKEDSLILSLEKKWAKLKYEVLEKDPAIYQKIRTLLKDKVHPDEALFNALILEALSQEAQAGRQLNALHHVWGYFKNIATQEEKAEFEKQLYLWELHEIQCDQLKQVLYTLVLKYKVDYLLNSSYFKNQI
jgi:UV DNA damage endonuclease